MAKVRKTYSLDERAVEKLEALAHAQGINASACFTVLVNQAYQAYEQLQQQQQSTAPTASK